MTQGDRSADSEAAALADEGVLVGTGTLGERLNQLFEASTPQGGRPPSLEKVCEFVERTKGVSMSTAYLSLLRRDSAKRPPRLDQLEGIADFFRVPVTYFVGISHGQDSELRDEQLKLIQSFKDSESMALGMKLGHLLSEKPERLAALRSVIEAMED